MNAHTGGAPFDRRVQSVIAARRRKYVTLSIAVSFIYAVVAFGFAFAPSYMARAVIGSSVSVGIVSIAAVMLVGIGCAGYYTWWANTVHDRRLEDTPRPVSPADR